MAFVETLYSGLRFSDLFSLMVQKMRCLMPLNMPFSVRNSLKKLSWGVWRMKRLAPPRLDWRKRIFFIDKRSCYFCPLFLLILSLFSVPLHFPCIFLQFV